jgi:hypothetical protein
MHENLGAKAITIEGTQSAGRGAERVALRRRGLRLVVIGVLLTSSCRPCHPLEPALINKNAYWPNRGSQKSRECNPERGPFRCVLYEPRCDEADPRCGPLPMGNYRHCYDPSAERKPVAAVSAGPSCHFDGECMVSDGCVTNYCTHYTVYPVGDGDVCEFSSSSWKAHDDLLCGCVHNRCVAFRL